MATGCSPPESQVLAIRAAQDPNMNAHDLKELAWALLEKATQGIGDAGAGAQFGLGIVEKQMNTTFLTRLHEYCWKILTNRHFLLPEFKPTEARSGGQPTCFSWWNLCLD